MIYLLGRRLFNKKVGLISAFILSISQLNIQYSQEARMYSMLLFLGLLSMYFFIRFLKGSLTISVGYIVSTSLVLYSHFFGLFVLIAQNISIASLLLQSKERRVWLKRWILTQATIVIIFAPWIIALALQVLNAQEQIYNPYWTNADPITIVLELAGGTWDTYNARVALLIVFLVLAAFSLFTFQKSSRNAVKSFTWEDREHLKVVGLCVVWLFSFLALPFLLAPLFSHPIIRARYVIAASVPLYLLVSMGIRNINYSYAKFAVIAIIVILSAANLQAYYGAQRNPTVANAIDFVNKNAKNGDLVIVFPNPGVFPYYISFRFESDNVPGQLFRSMDQNHCSKHGRVESGHARPPASVACYHAGCLYRGADKARF
jgi:uncharacterized membrane protein